MLRTQLAALQPDEAVVDPSEHAARLRAIRALRLRVDDVRAKFKYGGNVDRDHRAAVLARLDRPGRTGRPRRRRATWSAGSTADRSHVRAACP